MRKRILTVFTASIIFLGLFVNVIHTTQVFALDTLIDSYSETNYDGLNVIENAVTAMGQSFNATTSAYLTSCKFYLARSAQAPTVNLTAYLYAHTGTYGTNGVPIGNALDVSINQINASTLANAFPTTLSTFDFSGTYVLTANTKYYIIVAIWNSSGTIDGTHCICVGYDSTGTHGGNRAVRYDVSYWASSIEDVIFYVYGEPVEPLYSNIGCSTTLAGASCTFSCQWTSSIGLSGYVFGCNVTGYWTNETWVSLSGYSAWTNVTKVLDSAPGVVVEYRWCNNSVGYWEDTGIQTLSLAACLPEFSDISHSSDIPSRPSTFSCKWSTQGHSLSGYIFGSNNTGSWVNETFTSLSGDTAWANTTETLNSTSRGVIEYRWWCNDTANEWNDTGVLSFTMAWFINQDQTWPGNFLMPAYGHLVTVTPQFYPIGIRSEKSESM